MSIIYDYNAITCVNSTINSDRHVSAGNYGARDILSNPACCACATVQKPSLTHLPPTILSRRGVSWRMPSGLLTALALPPFVCGVASFVSASSAPRPLCAAGSPPLPDSSNHSVRSQIAPASSAAGMPRALAVLCGQFCLVLLKISLSGRASSFFEGRRI